MFALMFDGFVQGYRFDDFAAAKSAWIVASNNPLLYEYDCALVEVDNVGKIVRRISYQELTS